MLIPVVLSGGAVTRLWPVSRQGHPKPFMRLSDGQSLLEKTYRRATACDDVHEVLTITNRDYYFHSKDCFEGLDNETVKSHFLLEPMGRNTAPALLMDLIMIEVQSSSYLGEDDIDRFDDHYGRVKSG